MGPYTIASFFIALIVGAVLGYTFGFVGVLLSFPVGGVIGIVSAWADENL